MTWTRRQIEALLAEAFPLGAHVQLEGSSEFVALHIEVDDGWVRPDGVLLRFETDPTDTLQFAPQGQVEAAPRTGVLELEHATIRRPEPADVALLNDALRDLIGPQSLTGDHWVRRMRLHQSWWRTFRLRVPFGNGPTRNGTRLQGNMLRDHAADAGRNFLTDDAWRAYRERVELTRIGVDPWRTKHNLLASQPMAFNLFGHLRYNLALATRLFSALVEELDEVTEVEIERLSNALDDRTAFDVFVRYRTKQGGAGCIAIETKLTELFSQQEYEWSRYLRHTAFDRDTWTSHDAATLGDLRWSQLWRNHLLARAATAQDATLGTASMLVVHHPADPHCAQNVEGYRALLADPSSVRCIDLAEIVDVLRPLTLGTADEQWMRDLNDRYLDLTLSDPLIRLPDEH